MPPIAPRRGWRIVLRRARLGAPLATRPQSIGRRPLLREDSVAVRGIGIDVVQVTRLVQALERFGERMERRLFTETELSYCRGHKDPLPHLAARFAAKEAASKALGTGMSGGIGFRQFEVIQP